MTGLLELHPATAGLEVLKGRQTFCSKASFGIPAANTVPTALSGQLVFGIGNLGLKPQVESCHPFGISPTSPLTDRFQLARRRRLFANSRYLGAQDF
jgi:hypothetical protein